MIVASCWWSGRSEPGRATSSWPSAPRGRPASCCWSASAGRRAAWSASPRAPTWSPTPTATPRRVIERDPAAAERPDDGLLAEEGAHSEADERPALGGRPARRHHQLPLRLPRVGGEHRAGGRATAARSAWCSTRCATSCSPPSAARARTLNGEPIEVSGRERLDTALIATGFGYDAERRAAPGRACWRACCPRVRDIRRAGAAALDLCMVAAGRARRLLRARPAATGTGRPASRGRREAGGDGAPSWSGEPAGLVAASPAIADELHALVA